MFLDFLEIGTSDFHTEIQKANPETVGISIEPVKYYLDKLPNKKNCRKYNLAISDKNGESKVYYMSEANIKKYKFPSWVKGCNTINSYHPTVIKQINKKSLNIEDLIDSYFVKVMTLYSFLDKENIGGIFYLKIDTEGHDIIILNKFLDDIEKINTNHKIGKDLDKLSNELLPNKLLFESNVLTKKSKVKKIIERLEDFGYHLLKSGNDTLMELKT
jgi:FkbM family methyltransferase